MRTDKHRVHPNPPSADNSPANVTNALPLRDLLEQQNLNTRRPDPIQDGQRATHKFNLARQHPDDFDSDRFALSAGATLGTVMIEISPDAELGRNRRQQIKGWSQEGANAVRMSEDEKKVWRDRIHYWLDRNRLMSDRDVARRVIRGRDAAGGAMPGLKISGKRFDSIRKEVAKIKRQRQQQKISRPM